MSRRRTDHLAACFRFWCVLALGAALPAAWAAELGEPAVSSYIGQPLMADIELTALADPPQPVTVRMASPDVYQGANIRMHPALSGATMSVVRRDGRQYLRLVTSRPVDSNVVHLFVELIEGGKQNVRGTTLWLTPDPTPKPAAPPPAPVAAPLPAPVVSRAPVPAPEPAPPPRKPVREITLGQAAPPAACPALTEEKLKACAATEYQNGLLSAQIVELEEKVRQLQKELDGKQAVAASAAPAAASAPAVAKPAVPPPPPKKAATDAARDEGGFPWLLVSGIVVGLLALGGGVWFFLRRRKAAAADAPATPPAGWFSRLRKRKADAATVAAEPTLDQ